jgi:hypothetical protein
LTREELIDVLAMRRQRLAIREIPAATPYQPGDGPETGDRRRHAAGEEGDDAGGDRPSVVGADRSVPVAAPHLLATSVSEINGAEE